MHSNIHKHKCHHTNTTTYTHTYIHTHTYKHMRTSSTFSSLMCLFKGSGASKSAHSHVVATGVNSSTLQSQSRQSVCYPHSSLLGTAHTATHTATHRHTETQTHTDTQTHTHAHTHTHTHSLSLSGCRCLGRGRWLLQGMRHLCRPASPWSTWRMPSSTLTSCQRSVGALLLRVTTSSLLHEIQSFFALMSAEFSSLLALCF